MIRAASVNIPQTISGGVGGPSGGSQGGGGGTGEGPRMSYDINTEHFTMPVLFLMQDYRLEDSRVGLSESPTPREEKRRRMEGEDEIEVVKIIRSTDLELIREIGSGPEYLLHAGRNKSRAVIVKVFHRGPTVRQQLESTVALSKELMHPNVLRIKAFPPPHSLSRFIVYENGNCTNAEILLAAALKNDLARSVTLGFTMVAEVSVGGDQSSPHARRMAEVHGSGGISTFWSIQRTGFLILINAPQKQEVETAAPQEPEDNALIVFNALLDKTLMSANRILHKEEIKKRSCNSGRQATEFPPGNSAATSVSSTQNIQGDELVVPTRREYVWLAMDGRQALAEVSEGLTVDLKFHLSRLSRSTRTDGLSAHRCPGYVREEITLATTIWESAIVAHDTPSPQEICSVCREVVDIREVFRCICGDITPGSRHTIKCLECRVWSHSDCVGSPGEFTCGLCRPKMIHNHKAPLPQLPPPPLAVSSHTQDNSASGMEAIQAAHDELFYATFPDARPFPARMARVEAAHAYIYAPPEIQQCIASSSPVDVIGAVNPLDYPDEMYANSWAFYGSQYNQHALLLPPRPPPRLMMSLPHLDPSASSSPLSAPGSSALTPSSAVSAFASPGAMSALSATSLATQAKILPRPLPSPPMLVDSLMASSLFAPSFTEYNTQDLNDIFHTELFALPSSAASNSSDSRESTPNLLTPPQPASATSFPDIISECSPMPSFFNFLDASQSGREREEQQHVNGLRKSSS
ncbi:hypothetical protein B0H14DRAFT_3464471 [Mycena olivaceomarginata]|nr:hypothetical protein B0H14DRAFT_3464471 [Mycena olivaceomarginata]